MRADLTRSCTLVPAPSHFDFIACARCERAAPSAAAGGGTGVFFAATGALVCGASAASTVGGSAHARNHSSPPARSRSPSSNSASSSRSTLSCFSFLSARMRVCASAVSSRSFSACSSFATSSQSYCSTGAIDSRSTSRSPARGAGRADAGRCAASSRATVAAKSSRGEPWAARAERTLSDDMVAAENCGREWEAVGALCTAR